MTPPGDPYRVLGLPQGASLDDVKHAYRRLAKASHPDSAGPTATARFIALQQAYEVLLRIAPASRRPTATRASRRPAPGARPRPRATAPSGPGGAGRASGGGAPAGMPGGARNGGQPSKGPRTDPADEASARRRAARRATLGTTSYDDAELGRPSDWQGASWYGVSTGTYWTINPKEYADPRKHGPEYLARGRRQEPGEADDTGSAEAEGVPLAPPGAPLRRDATRTQTRPRPPGLLRRIIERARGDR